MKFKLNGNMPIVALKHILNNYKRSGRMLYTTLTDTEDGLITDSDKLAGIPCGVVEYISGNNVVVKPLETTSGKLFKDYIKKKIPLQLDPVAYIAGEDETGKPIWQMGKSYIKLTLDKRRLNCIRRS